MIKEIWIVDKQTGTTLLQRSYGHQPTSDRLMSGFLQAIYGLYQYAEAELASAESGKGLESINMAGMRWLYVEKKGLIFIAATDKETPLSLLIDQLNLIADNFIGKFGSPFEALYGGGLDKWLQGDFSGFLPELDDIISQWEQVKKVENAAKIMDFLDVVQNVMEKFQNYPGFSTLIEGGHLDILGQAFSDGNWDMSFLSDLDEKDLKEKISNILNHMMEFFIAQNVNVRALNQQYIHPYMKTDWIRIKEVGLDELFIELFL
ncbi:MAG: hypothetical protein ACXQS8_06305 [Candidatus Helarchaeales archaeon]